MYIPGWPALFIQPWIQSVYKKGLCLIALDIWIGAKLFIRACINSNVIEFLYQILFRQFIILLYPISHLCSKKIYLWWCRRYLFSSSFFFLLFILSWPVSLSLKSCLLMIMFERVWFYVKAKLHMIQTF